VQPPPLNHLRSPPEPPPHHVPQPHWTAAVPSSDTMLTTCVSCVWRLREVQLLPLWNQACSSCTSRSTLLMGLSNWTRPIPFQHRLYEKTRPWGGSKLIKSFACMQVYEKVKPHSYGPIRFILGVQTGIVIRTNTFPYCREHPILLQFTISWSLFSYRL
jgi:hypothetical protein